MDGRQPLGQLPVLATERLLPPAERLIDRLLQRVPHRGEQRRGDQERQQRWRQRAALQQCGETGERQHKSPGQQQRESAVDHGATDQPVHIPQVIPEDRDRRADRQRQQRVVGEHVCPGAAQAGQD